jgi:hypothetical protein
MRYDDDDDEDDGLDPFVKATIVGAFMLAAWCAVFGLVWFVLVLCG